MRQARRAEHQRESEADEVEAGGPVTAVGEAGREERLAVAAAFGGGVQQAVDVAVETQQDEDGQSDGAAEQQDRLHDLDPGGRAHAAERHVDHHEGADADHGPGLHGLAGAAEEQRDEASRADHLRHQVQHGHGDGGGAGGDAHRPLPHPCGDHVGEREPAAVADQFGDQEEHHQPGHEEAHRVEHAVVADEGDESGDTEEGCGRHVVAGEGKTIFHRREETVARVELLGGALAVAAHPGGDDQGDGDERAEQQQGGGAVVGRHDAPPLPRVSSWVSQRSSSAARSRRSRAWRT